MFIDGILTVLYTIFLFLQYVGKTVFGIIRSVVTAVLKLLFSAVKKMFSVVFSWLAGKLKQPLYDLWCFVLTPIAHAIGHIAHTRIQFRKAKKVSLTHALGVLFRSLGKIFAGIGKALVHIFNYAALVVCVLFLISLIRYASSLSYTVTVAYNGNELGVISSDADYSEAQSLIQDKITYTSEDSTVLETPTFMIRMASDDDNPIDVDSLSELMLQSSDVNVVDAYGFYINGTLFGVYEEEEMQRVKSALEALQAKYYSSNTIYITFEEEVEIVSGRYIDTNIVSADDAIDYINGEKTVEAFYVVGEGESLSSIAASLGYSEDDLINENPIIADSIKFGDILTYHYTESNLTVITAHYENYDEVVERETRYTYDSSMEQYNEILKQSGSDGLRNVTALVTEKNGSESERLIASSYTILEMVPRIFIVGTAENKTLKGDTHIIDLLGTFVWPVGGDGGYVSSTYGYRSWDRSNHYAIDIAADYGTDIYAAADGEVIFAGRYSAYGELVIIDHGNGYVSYYGHQSSIDVSVGDIVEKGDVIGHVGMTGSASGNHLHFEMRYNDSRFDPILCLGGYSNHSIRE